MKDLLKKAAYVLLWAWQLPQNLLGFILFQIYSVDCLCLEVPYRDVHILYSEKMRGGISLGQYIVLPWRYRGYYQTGSYIDKTIKHEYGHTRQSLYLGWLYLVLVGLPSLLWAWAHSAFRRLRTVDYYSFWMERWADRLGGVRR